MPEIPDFDSAVSDFKKFLINLDVGTDIVWFFREDIAAWRKRLWIRWPFQTENFRLAEQEYNRGQQIGIGIQLYACCRVGDKVCCLINIAENEAEASWQMLYGLKLTSASELPQAYMIQKMWLWRLIFTLWRDRTLTNEIPVRPLMH